MEATDLQSKFARLVAEFRGAVRKETGCDDAISTIVLRRDFALSLGVLPGDFAAFGSVVIRAAML